MKSGKLNQIYKIYRAFIYLFLVLSFGSSIYYYNEVQTLRKIIRTNTDIKSDKEIDAVVKDIQVYDKTGKLPESNNKKPLDRLLDKALKDKNAS